MAVSNLPIRFTDEKYLTKVEVIKELQLSLIDDIWKDILNYRNAYKTQLTIKTIPQIPFGVTLTDVISAKVEAFGSLLTRFNEALNKLPKGSKEREAFDVYAKTRLLRDVGFLEKASLPEANLKAIIAGIEPVDLPSRKLSSYCQALSYLQQAAGQPLGEDLVGAYYQRLLGDEEMTVFYRISDPVTANMYRTMHFSKEHEFAPYGMIPDCMEELSSFATNVSYNPIIKAFGALYYIDYVRPFECHSETVAALFAKNILTNSYYYDCIAYVPFESVLVKNDRYKEYSKHCQREADLTYIILYGLDILTKRVEDLIYYAGTSYRDLLHNEVYQASEQKVAETKKDPVQIDIFEASKEPKEEPTPVPAPAKEPEPVLEEKKEEPEEEELETIQEPIVNNTYTYVSSWNTSYVYYEPERPKPAPEKKPEPVVQEEPTPEPVVEPEPFVEPEPTPVEEKFEPAPEPEPTREQIEEKAVEPEIEPKAEEPH
ncbi:MAG: hypothetical protein MJ239_06490, partial [Bacilli bacterium]|nr:hypothetical protein [Bacilli bacterium]